MMEATATEANNDLSKDESIEYDTVNFASVKVVDDPEDPLKPDTTTAAAEETSSGDGSDDAMMKKPAAASQGHVVVPNGFMARRAKHMARRPWWYFTISLVISVALSVAGILGGGFQVAVDNAGWRSRGTLISERATQAGLVQSFAWQLSSGDAAEWDELENNVQEGWESIQNRRLKEEGEGPKQRHMLEFSKPGEGGNTRQAPFDLNENFLRRLEDAPALSGCPTSHYRSNRALNPNNLWPLWKATTTTTSALDPQVIRDICIAEENTNAVLEKYEACLQCSTGRCIPPVSLVMFARVTVGDTWFALSCDELAEEWSAFQSNTTSLLQACIPVVQDNYVDELTVQTQCTTGFGTFMVDGEFGPTEDFVGYTSSVFATAGYASNEELYAIVGEYDRAKESTVVEGAYDTENEAFGTIYTDASVSSDMILAMASAAVTATAILVHTRSPWITMVGLVQIILSFPLAFFVYTFIGQLDFFPFLNFIGVFVVFALGADDIFVAIDKWKNARLDNRSGSVEDIAAVALPDAAGAMFLTTTTTAVAFFATAICPVAPLKCFAIFCGLLIVFDYFMCVVLVFPALCIYDRWLGRKNNFCCSLHVCKKQDEEFNDVLGEDDAKPSFIRRVLTGFYNGFHKIRWILMVLCLAATGVSIWYATKLEMPQSSDVRLLSDALEYEKNYNWRLELFYTQLEKSGGNPGVVMWGVKPADTGKHTDPTTWTSLVLDDDFDMTSVENQQYMLGFCDTFFAQDFASYTVDPDEFTQCGINRFDAWLQEEAAENSTSSVWATNCDGAGGLPMNPSKFNECISAYTNLNSVNDLEILEKEGVLKIVYFSFQQRVRFDSPFDDLDKEWKLIENWMKKERASAPEGVNKFYHSSGDFWWYDTNGRMLQAAFGAAGIALGFSGVVVLFSSRSVVLTIFCLVTIGYVLAATTATLVASGWTLGFLESVCFAILIGISCDFVIHFAHAYSSMKGEVSRHIRTKHALIRMGPSILAAAFTTICAAIIMLFTVISFFQQFAQILFYTVIHASIGSFIMLLVLTDCIGPSNPTYLVDKWTAYCFPPKEGQATGEYSSGEAKAVEDTEEKAGSNSTLEPTEKPQFDEAHEA